MSELVNEKLSEVLAWSGMTQQELSDVTGISRANISAYVTGRSAVSIEQIYKLAPALGVTPWTLMNMESLPVSPLELTKEEEGMVKDIRALNLQQREIIFSDIELMKKHNAENKKQMRTV